MDDQFSITGGLGAGTPTICGTNTGYHSKSEAILLPNGTRSELYLIILTVANIHSEVLSTPLSKLTCLTSILNNSPIFQWLFDGLKTFP